MTQDQILGEVRRSDGTRVILLERVWREKILSSHPEMDSQVNAVLRTVSAPDWATIDPVYERRHRYYLRNAGPSRWLLVVVSYEQTPARIISAFGTRKDPRAWRK